MAPRPARICAHCLPPRPQASNANLAATAQPSLPQNNTHEESIIPKASPDEPQRKKRKPTHAAPKRNENNPIARHRRFRRRCSSRRACTSTPPLTNPLARIGLVLVGLVGAVGVADLALEVALALLVELEDALPIRPPGVGVDVHLDDTSGEGCAEERHRERRKTESARGKNGAARGRHRVRSKGKRLLGGRTTEEDEQVGVRKYGVNHYESTSALKVKTPTRLALMGPPDLPALPPAALPAPDPEAATQLVLM